MVTEREVSEYMEKVMPKTWHVLTDIKDMRPGHLYIQVFSFNTNEGFVVGGAGPLRYIKGAGLANLEIYYERQWRETVLHELAHIAVDRWWSWRTGYGRDKPGECLVLRYGTEKRIEHDAIFRKALRTVIARAEKLGVDYGYIKKELEILEVGKNANLKREGVTKAWKKNATV